MHSYTTKPFQKLTNGKVRIIGEIYPHQNVFPFIFGTQLPSAQIETINNSIAYFVY